MATLEDKLLAMLKPERFRHTSSDPEGFSAKHPFESDYFRIVTSAPMRRLQDKTQIFPQEKSDFVRRRLTHSIEVGAIGRRLGWMVEDKLKEQGVLGEKYAGVYEHSLASILETAGLVHDIGNPPFGHFGETTIQTFFVHLQDYCANDKAFNQFKMMSKEKQQDFLHFDGNVQGLRILRHLGLSADDNSFNLTMPTLAAIIKYPYSSTKGNKDPKSKENKGKQIAHSQEKFGYFHSEAATYNTIYDKLSMKKNQRHPLAYLLEAADDIANVTSDVEDGFKMGIISLEKIKSVLAEYKIQSSYEKIDFDKIENFLEKQQEECTDKTLIPPGITNELRVKEFRIRCVTALMSKARDIFIENLPVIVEAAYKDGSTPSDEILGRGLLEKDPLFEALSKLQRKTYVNREVLKSELLGENVITELLSMFVGCMFSPDIKRDKESGKLELKTKTSDGKLYALISDNYKRAAGCKSNEIPKDPYRRFLLAVDHVSGMTDSYAVDLYNELNNRKI